MAAIPGWVYILLGAVMIGASKIINNSTKTNSLTIFFYIGILFVVIGLGKYIFNAVFRKKDANHVKPSHAHKIRQAMMQSARQPQQQAMPQQPLHQIPPHLQQQHNVHRINQPSSVQSHQQSQYPQSQQQYQQFAQHPSIIACPACNTRHYDYANYCMKCGTKIKK